MLAGAFGVGLQHAGMKNQKVDQRGGSGGGTAKEGQVGWDRLGALANKRQHDSDSLGGRRTARTPSWQETPQGRLEALAPVPWMGIGVVVTVRVSRRGNAGGSSKGVSQSTPRRRRRRRRLWKRPMDGQKDHQKENGAEIDEASERSLRDWYIGMDIAAAAGIFGESVPHATSLLWSLSEGGICSLPNHIDEKRA